MDLASFRRRLFQNALDTKRPFASVSRWPLWLAACALRRSTVVRFATGGLKMRLIPRLHSFGSTSLFIKRDHYEPELLAISRLIAPGSVVLDIGGSFGVFALFMAHFVGPQGRVHSFEPGRFSFEQLERNVALNPAAATRITLHKVAATDVPASLELYHVADSPVNFSVGKAEGATSETVPAMRVDALVSPEEAARVSFIKIDVEGYEIAALEGARAIIEKSLPTIMFEVSEDALGRQGLAPADIYRFLGDFGYRFWGLDQRSRFVPVTGTPDGNIFASTRDLGNA